MTALLVYVLGAVTLVLSTLALVQRWGEPPDEHDDDDRS